MGNTQTVDEKPQTNKKATSKLQQLKRKQRHRWAYGSLKLFNKEREKWLVTWPLIKHAESDDENKNDKDTDDDDSEYYVTKSGKLLYLFDTESDRDDEMLENATNVFQIEHGFSIFTNIIHWLLIFIKTDIQ